MYIQFLQVLKNLTLPDIFSAAALIIVSVLFGKYLISKIKENGSTSSLLRNFLHACSSAVIPLIMSLLFFINCLLLDSLNVPLTLNALAFKITLSWLSIVIIMLLANRKLAWWFTSIVVIPLIILNLFGIWGHGKDAIYVLQHIRFQFGSTACFTLFHFLIVLIAIVVLLRFSKLLNTFSKEKLSRVNDSKTSMRLLVIKILQVILYLVIFFVALNLFGVDVTTLTVFGGAIGVGLGFGLQKITSNFVSGIILLLEKSIEIGDLIELNDGTLGNVKHTAARYTLIETNQGKEVLVPNEDFITQRVTNWTYNHHKSRIEIPVHVSYKSDLDLVKKLILDAALEHPKCLKDPAPNCYLTNFGDLGASFMLYFWIEDIMHGRDQPHSDVMFAIWNKFKQNNIEIPYLQRGMALLNK